MDKKKVKKNNKITKPVKVPTQRRGRAKIENIEKGVFLAEDFDFESDGGDDPCCQGRTDVGPHDHADGVLHVHNAGPDKSQHHERDRRAALQQSGDQGAAADGAQPAVGIHPDDAPERPSGQGLDRLLDQLHPEKENAESGQQFSSDGRHQQAGCQNDDLPVQEGFQFYLDTHQHEEDRYQDGLQRVHQALDGLATILRVGLPATEIIVIQPGDGNV